MISFVHLTVEIHLVKTIKMKTLAFFLVLFISLQAGKAQFTLEKTYDFSLTSTRINASAYKYYLMDVPKSECRIYHLDHTLWKTIPIALPANYYLYDIQFVTQNLFNADSNIELWFSAYNWVPVGDDGYYRYISKVIDETGRVLTTIDGGLYASILPVGEDAYKMAVYAYDNSFWPGSIKTYLYSIPGTQTAIWHAVTQSPESYPNPARDLIHLIVPTGNEFGVLKVFSLTGSIMKEIPVEGKTNIELSIHGWPSGTYLYHIADGQSISQTAKFVVY